MSNAGHFNNKHAQQEKQAHIKRARFFEDFPTKLLRDADGTPFKAKGGKIVWREPKTPVKESKHIAKADVATPESKFYKQTPITTLVEKTTAGEKAGSSDTMGEKDTASRIRKRIDVNAPSMRL